MNNPDPKKEYIEKISGNVGIGTSGNVGIGTEGINEGTALVKFSKSEIELLINSLYMSTTTKIPTEQDGRWKTPYESLLKDLKDIKRNMLEKARQNAISGKKEETK